MNGPRGLWRSLALDLHYERRLREVEVERLRASLYSLQRPLSTSFHAATSGKKAIDKNDPQSDDHHDCST